jgi:glycosyltransferase involved in cell wall biosynthesis
MLSVLCIAHNHREVTEMFLASLARPECADLPYELVFIDNGSTDDTLSLVQKYPLSANPNFRGLKARRFSRNLGVAAAINQAAEMARFPVLLQADNDVVFGPSSFSRLFLWLERFPGALISPAWPWLQKKIRRDAFRSPADVNPAALAKLAKLAARAPLLLNHGTGACWMCGSKLFKRVKGWDTAFVGNCASDDFQWKIALAGAPRLTVPCPIYHFGEITRRTVPNSARQQEDLALFRTRWGAHPENLAWLAELLAAAGIAQFPPDAAWLYRPWVLGGQTAPAPALGKTKPPKLSALILAKNEEKDLPRLLKSLSWVDEIILVDSLSTDRTVQIARQFKARVISRAMQDFSSQWNAGLAVATGDWVFAFDADEEVPMESVPLLQEAFRQAPGTVGGFRVLRRNFALGRWLRHGQQYGKRVQWYDLVRRYRGHRAGDTLGGAVKLFRRQGAAYENLVHEEVRVPGSIVQLQAYVNHYTADSIRDMFDKVNLYTTLHARQIYEKSPGQPPRHFYRQVLWLPVRTFVKAYWRKQGFRDGFPGLARCLSMYCYELLKALKLYDFYFGVLSEKENHPR